MTDIGITILAIIGAIYLTLTVYIAWGDHRRRVADERYTEDEAFRKFVEAMKRLEYEEDADA
jgi:hypothetical protein